MAADCWLTRSPPKNPSAEAPAETTSEPFKQTQIDKVFQDFYLGQITAIEKNRAEAKKTSTVDTQLTEAQTDYTNSLKRLTDTKENTEAANYNLILQKQSLVFEQARNLAIRTDIDEATKQTQIDKVFQDFYLGQITAIEKNRAEANHAYTTIKNT